MPLTAIGVQTVRMTDPKDCGMATGSTGKFGAVSCGLKMEMISS